ncbi:MAG: hypothetical protein BWY30_00516 [Tenericutes bacterium ADurb.Bin239]|nr:MAG: hypothetical protein BWY30_00516 [Tenericutes bacterium ADurb.Bin239]
MKRKSFKNRFLMFLTTLAMAFSVGVSLNAKAPVATKAAIIPAGEKLYLKVNDQWKTDNARFATYFFNSGGPDIEWADAKRVLYAENLYVVDIPAGTFDTYIMCRMNPATSTNDWPNKWNQTANITYDATTTLTRITGWTTSVQEAYVASEHLFSGIPASRVLYLRPHDVFDHVDFHHLAAYYYVGSESVFVDMTEHATGVYKVTTPAPTSPEATGGWEKVIFVSMKAAANNWDNKLHQTDDLIHPGTADMIYDAKQSAWHALTNLLPQTPSVEGITSNKVRFWINRNSHYENIKYQYLFEVGGVYYTVTGYTEVYTSTFFLYFDLPLAELLGNIITLYVVDTEGYRVEQLASITYTAQDNSKLWGVHYESGWKLSSYAVEGRIKAGFVAKVLEGYLSCSNSIHNGYGAFNLIDQNFIPRVDGTEEWNVEGNIGDILISDYVAEADYGDVSKRVADTTNGWNKYQMLKALGGGGSSGQNRVNETTNTNIIYVLVIGMLFGIATLGFIRFRKKPA